MEKIIAVIPARYRSSRFPGKPLAPICGKPMIWWVYNQVKKVEEVDELYVATDDERIKKTCDEYGMSCIMTSPDCNTGSDRVAEVAKKVPGDIYINVQGDEPLIQPEMIRELISVFGDKEVYFGSLKKKIKDPSEIQANSTVKVVTDVNGDALYFSRSVIPSNSKGEKVDVYRHVGIYGYRHDFLLKFGDMQQSELELGEGIEPLRAMERGYKIRIKETGYSTIGVDYPEHITMVENELRNKE